jgi:hypothetical protein
MAGIRKGAESQNSRLTESLAILRVFVGHGVGQHEALYSTGTITAVPEPALWLLAAVAGAILVQTCRRRAPNSRA